MSVGGSKLHRHSQSLLTSSEFIKEQYIYQPRPAPRSIALRGAGQSHRTTRLLALVVVCAPVGVGAGGEPARRERGRRHAGAGRRRRGQRHGRPLELARARTRQRHEGLEQGARRHVQRDRWLVLAVGGIEDRTANRRPVRDAVDR